MRSSRLGVLALAALVSAADVPRLPPVASAGECPDRLQRFEEAGIIWEADPGLERLGRRLAEDPRTLAPMPAIGEIRRELGGATVRLARDLACAEPSAPGADWVAGAAWPERAYVAVRAGEAVGAVQPVRRVLRHEFAHLVLHRTTNGRTPRWLNEGYAQLAAGEWGWDQAWGLRLDFLRGHASLTELSLGFPADAEGAATAYLLSYTAVEQLLALGGEPGLRAVFEALARGQTFDAALRSVYGLTADQFEQRWKKAVSSRYGVLFVLSRAAVFWLGVTLLLLWFGGRRRRRDRAKLEKMRRDELEDAAETVPFEVIDPAPWDEEPR